MLHIKQPYLVAGWKYGWTRQGYRQIGVGINVELLHGDGYLDMKIGKSKHIWRIDKEVARDFILKYQSHYEADMGVVLGVVSWDMKLFKKIEVGEGENNLFVQSKK